MHHHDIEKQEEESEEKQTMVKSRDNEKSDDSDDEELFGSNLSTSSHGTYFSNIDIAKENTNSWGSIIFSIGIALLFVGALILVLALMDFFIFTKQKTINFILLIGSAVILSFSFSCSGMLGIFTGVCTRSLPSKSRLLFSILFTLSLVVLGLISCAFALAIIWFDDLQLPWIGSIWKQVQGNLIFKIISTIAFPIMIFVICLLFYLSFGIIHLTSIRSEIIALKNIPMGPRDGIRYK